MILIFFFPTDELNITTMNL